MIFLVVLGLIFVVHPPRETAMRGDEGQCHAKSFFELGSRSTFNKRHISNFIRLAQNSYTLPG